MISLEAVMRTHGFIHIPNTGGTSIESKLNATAAIIHRKHAQKFAASPWHLPPDVYEALTGRRYARPSFCVVREPRERLQSCLNWRYANKFHTPLSNLSSIYSVGRTQIRWTEERLHRMPQWWFVWADDGRVLCDCVIAYEKLNFSVHLNAGEPSQRVMTISAFPRDLYSFDALLHRTALREPNLCYRPGALWPSIGISQSVAAPGHPRDEKNVSLAHVAGWKGHDKRT